MRTLGRLLLVLGLFAWLAAAGWLLWNALTEPSPPREVAFVTRAGEQPPLSCQGSIFSSGRHLWQICRSPGGKRAHLVRFDLKRGVGEMLWPLERPDATISALARSKTGALALATESGALASGGPMEQELHIAQPAGGLQRMKDAPRVSRIAGMAWVQDQLELVAPGGGSPIRQAPSPGSQPSSQPINRGPVIHVHAKGAWTTRQAPNVNDAAAGHVTQLDLAYRSGGHWNLLFARIPERSPAGRPVTVELLHGTESQPPMTVDAARLTGRFIHDPGGKVKILGSVVDRAPGGAVNPAAVLPSLPLQRRKQRWRALVAPQKHRQGRFWLFDYTVEPQGLRSIPRTTSSPRSFHVQGVWLELVGGDVAQLHKIGSTLGPGLTSSFWLDPGPRVLPAADGGYWVLGASSRRYIKVTTGLERADPLSIWERIQRIVHEPDPRGALPSALVAARRAVVPVVLLLWPLLVLLLLLVGRSRRRGRAGRFFIASLLYLLCCGALGWWFWQLVRWF